MSDDLGFSKDLEYEKFIQTAAVSLSAHEMSLRRLAGLMNDLNYFSRVARGLTIKGKLHMVDLIVYFETLKQIFGTAIYPVYGDAASGLKAKLDAAKKKIVGRENNITVIDDLEVIELEIIRKLNEKGLLYEVKEKIAGRVGLQ